VQEDEGVQVLSLTLTSTSTLTRRGEFVLGRVLLRVSVLDKTLLTSHEDDLHSR
jgi:hypothetical protein